MKEKFKMTVLISLILGLIVGFVIGYLARNPTGQSQKEMVKISTSEKTKEGLTILVPLISEENQLVTPKEDDLIPNPVAVAGNLFVFENQFSIGVFDAQGKELGRQDGYSHSPDIGKPGPFVELVSFVEPKTEEGKIEIWASSPRDGSREVLFSVPIKFR